MIFSIVLQCDSLLQGVETDAEGNGLTVIDSGHLICQEPKTCL
jgi:hypothetical protein